MPQNDPVLDGRCVLWGQELTAFGYVLETPPRTSWLPSQRSVFARRPLETDGPPATILITEQWVLGEHDPQRLGLIREGCTLIAASWHAQIDETTSDPATRAMRLDVDPTKPPRLHLHTHPFGRPNQVREPLVRLPEPADWIEGVETVICDEFY